MIDINKKNNISPLISLNPLPFRLLVATYLALACIVAAQNCLDKNYCAVRLPTDYCESDCDCDGTRTCNLGTKLCEGNFSIDFRLFKNSKKNRGRRQKSPSNKKFE